MSKLLIVDDELDVREFARNFFKKRKIDCLTAESGEEALKIISSDKPQLVLLDIRMSGMNGLDVLKKIKEIDKAIDVIMVTGVEEEEGMKNAKELGASGYIHKPLKLDELEETVLKRLAKK